LEVRKPKVTENTKKSLFLKGPKGSDVINNLLKDLAKLKRPDCLVLNKKNDIRPFENAVPVETLSKQHDCSLFVYGSHSKKRPNNLVIGRTFDGQLLDMFELGVKKCQELSEFKNEKFSVGAKPLVLFMGEDFQMKSELQRLQNMLLDAFKGPQVDQMYSNGIEHAIVFTTVEETVYMRVYRLKLERIKNSRFPKVELIEIGPSVDMELRRTHVAPESYFQNACKKPKDAKPKKVKNVREDKLGTTFGRIHMQSQNINKIQLRKMKGLKKGPLKLKKKTINAAKAKPVEKKNKRAERKKRA